MTIFHGEIAVRYSMICSLKDKHLFLQLRWLFPLATIFLPYLLVIICLGWIELTSNHFLLSHSLFRWGTRSTTLGSIFNSKVLFVICHLYYSYIERATSWVVPPHSKVVLCVITWVARQKPKTTSHYNFCTNNLRRNDLENKTQGITFNPDVGITIWVLDELKWLQQCWYCSTHLNVGISTVFSKSSNACTVKSYVHV